MCSSCCLLALVFLQFKHHYCFETSPASVLSCVLFSQEALQYGQHCRKINTSCLLQKVLLLPWVTSCQSMMTEKQWLVGRISRASHHFMQSITSWALLLPGFSAVLTQIITFSPQNVVLLRFWNRRLSLRFDESLSGCRITALQRQERQSRHTR